jgi:hypothetical protein
VVDGEDGDAELVEHVNQYMTSPTFEFEVVYMDDQYECNNRADSHGCISILVTMQNISQIKKMNCRVSSISSDICILNYLITRINDFKY